MTATTVTLDRTTAATGASDRFKLNSFTPYVYRGTGRDELTPELDTFAENLAKARRLERERKANAERVNKNRPPAACGTYAAANRHRAHGEELDEACREAERAYHRSRRTGQPKPGKKRPVKPCGTVAAYRRHMRHGEQPCTDCQTALNEYNSARAAERKAARHARKAADAAKNRQATRKAA